MALAAEGCEQAGEAPAAKGPYAQQFHHSFKDNPQLRPGWQLIGLDAEQHVRLEPAGLRIRLPPGHKENSNTGLSTFIEVRGDFEITLGYEVLTEPTPAESPRQTRLTLYVPLVGKGPSGPNRVTLSRRVTQAGTEYFPWRLWLDSASGQIHKGDGKLAPAQGSSGRLRLTRAGGKVSYWAAEGPAGDFTLLDELPFGADDVKNVGIYAALGGPKATLDVRILDLQVRAAALGNVPAASTSPTTGGRHSVAGVAVVATIGIGFVVIGLLVRRRQRQQSRRVGTVAP